MLWFCISGCKECVYNVSKSRKIVFIIDWYVLFCYSLRKSTNSFMHVVSNCNIISVNNKLNIICTIAPTKYVSHLRFKNFVYIVRERCLI